MSSEPITSETPATAPPAPTETVRAADARLATVSSLLENLETPAEVPVSDSTELFAFENQLVQVRLGMASSLFAALRAKHAPTAAHSVRVALSCSAWAAAVGQSESQRDELEVAALLHDVGKIGIPDEILHKTTKLTADEFAQVERHRLLGGDILRACCSSQTVLDVVEYAGAWFNGSREGYDRLREDLPLGARMVSIVDAFDAMTSEQVYRRAMSRERAIAELFEFAGSQFDPRLVQEFCGFIEADQVKLQAVVARRWLKDLAPAAGEGFWRLSRGPLSFSAAHVESLFHRKMVDSMHDAVVFVDGSLRIVLWNRAAERLTGILAPSIEHKVWSPTLISLRDEQQKLIVEADCPVIQSIKSGVQTLRRLSLAGRNGQRVEVDAHLVPIHGKNGISHGAALLMHDASSQITLEQRVQSLHEKATRDPLTQVANRAEFDRIQANWVESHLERRLPCSLVICDIDHFKKINDSFGHPAGDEVLIAFATLLRRHCRSGDLVARYGGEEFVMLCADCDNGTATCRAEELRCELAELPMPALDGKCITASFGVTELQAGDTPETMLRRADRALYQAKEIGRNAVVQLGTGIGGEEPQQKRTGWWAWLLGSSPEQVLERNLASSVPLNLVVEKLRGFVADHFAQIESIDERQLVLHIDGENSSLLRRSGDRPIPFLIKINLEEFPAGTDRLSAGRMLRTLLRVTIRPQRSRDRRRRGVLENAQRLLASLKSYLMAQDLKSLG
ncbi:MAG: diguanylate cyclase [Planctomycetaceae bacterium]|nr:diguanylate cyclase [Planctomycetaceae bacterium]